ncbi:cell envelope integrity protein TolA [Polaromonas sp. YR568]|uniref:cell envelope integrity protein TolA n=1 Tax=Polaromonas sp. YR568 TaxID=1855301 RepID=UPI00398C02F1
MPSAADRLDFLPPRDGGSGRAFALALLAHALLIAALTWGVNWKRSTPDVAFQAELWTNVPAQQAAPKPVEVPTPPPPPPPPPTPTPEVRTPPPPPEPKVDIALEQEKKRKQVQEQKEAEAERLKEKQKADLQAKKVKDAEKQKAADKKAQEDLAKRKAADDAKKLEAQKDNKDAAQQKAAQAAAEKLRQENLRRITGMAGATGDADSKGTAQKSSGGSTTYGAIVRAAIKPNVVFTEEFTGNPMAKVEVRLTLDGTVISQRLVQSSGNKAWDDAAINAIVRTRVMPRDVDGRIPDTTLILEMRPRN